MCPPVHSPSVATPSIACETLCMRRDKRCSGSLLGWLKQLRETFNNHVWGRQLVSQETQTWRALVDDNAWLSSPSRSMLCTDESRVAAMFFSFAHDFFRRVH